MAGSQPRKRLLRDRRPCRRDQETERNEPAKGASSLRAGRPLSGTPPTANTAPCRQDALSPPSCSVPRAPARGALRSLDAPPAWWWRPCRRERHGPPAPGEPVSALRRATLTMCEPTIGIYFHVKKILKTPSPGQRPPRAVCLSPPGGHAALPGSLQEGGWRSDGGQLGKGKAVLARGTHDPGLIHPRDSPSSFFLPNA